MKKWFIFGIILVFTFLIFGCKNPTDGNFVISRYTTVPYGSLNRAAGSEPYVLAYMCKDSKYYYYIYYLGYVQNVPVVYKETYRYEGITPITFSYEKTESITDTVTESLTKATENTITSTVGVSIAVKSGVEASVPGINKVSLETTVTGSVEAGYLHTTLTSNTLDTAIAKMAGETQTLSVTVGNNYEPTGRYRYALFSTTDVYCTYKVDKDSREIITQDVIYIADPDTYSWGIDYEPDMNGKFGKTGGGELLTIPAINFTTAPVPVDVILDGSTTEAPEAPPNTSWTDTRTNTRTVNDSTTNITTDLYNTGSWFNLSKLKTEGYKNFKIKIDFQAMEIDDGWVNVYVVKGNNTKYTAFTQAPAIDKWGFSFEKIDLDRGKWNECSLEFTVPIDQYYNIFSILWDASGSGNDDYLLASRTITIDMLK